MKNDIVAALAASVCVIAIATPAQAQQRQFDVPAGSLKAALDAYARQSGRAVIYRSEEVRSAKSSGFKGVATPEAALNRIVAGSGFRPQTGSGTSTAIVRDRLGGSAPGEDVAEGIPAVSENTEIVVTGTRIRGAKPTSPVVSASRERIAELGHADLGSYVRSIPQNYNGGQNPGVVSARQNGSENTTSSSALNLRGLGPDATLTLLNGHRLAYDAASQGIDISSIPLAAVKRIEIVADGASALYGSDAVGGVANIILRRDFDGLETSARIGGTTEGGAFQQQYSAVTGHRWKQGGFMIAGDFYRTTDILAGQRSYTDGAVNPDMTIYPSIRQWSAVLTGHQTIGEVLEFEIDAHYNLRESSVSLPNGSGSIVSSGSTATPNVESYSISPSLTFHLPADWDVTARITRAISDSRIKAEVFSGGSRLFVNDVRYKNDLWSAEIGGDGPIFTLPGGDARIALGAGLRSNGLRTSIYRTTPTTAFSIQDYAGSQSATFSYGEIFIPLISGENAVPFVHSLQFTGAVRYERYEEIGSLATPKFGISYQPIEDLTLKGSWGKSFKAPTLSQSNIAAIATLYSPTRYLPSPPTNRNVLQIDGSRKALEPERANAFTLTAELSPSTIPGFRIEASFFDIRYKNRVTYPIASSSVSFRPEYADLIIFSPTLEQVLNATANIPLGVQNMSGSTYDPGNLAAIIYTGYQNVARQNIQGVDGSIAYAFFSGRNAFNIEGNASYLKSNQQLSAGQPVFQQAGTIFRPPHWRGSAIGTWKRGAVTSTIAYNYLGGTEDARATTIYRVKAFHSFDATIGWKPEGAGIWAGWSFLLNSQNLFNRKPSLIRTTSVVFPNYDATNYPASGRTISLTVSKAW